MPKLLQHTRINDREFGPTWDLTDVQVTAIVAWCADHGIDAARIPASSTIVCDPKTMTITYDRTVVDATGRLRLDGLGHLMTERVVHQLDQPPAPWPEIFEPHLIRGEN